MSQNFNEPLAEVLSDLDFAHAASPGTRARPAATPPTLRKPRRETSGKRLSVMMCPLVNPVLLRGVDEVSVGLMLKEQPGPGWPRPGRSSGRQGHGLARR